MRIGVAAFIVSTCLGASASAQSPDLSRAQRDLLGAMVSAVDGASAAAETDDASLRIHVMRASDGSHYVAFRIAAPPSSPLPGGRIALYVRLAASSASASQRAERSLIREWLAGTQAAPPPNAYNRGIAIGDMPVMGATGNIANPARAPMNAQTADLAAMDLERRRARERQEARDRQRRAELEGHSASTSDTLPFEDFDLASPPSRVIERALTAGPGDYFLYLAWADPGASKPAVHIVKKRLTLPAATTTELTIGSVILADSIQIRKAPYQPAEQASHPYAIGLTEIVPSPDASFTDNENLSVVFQVINAMASDAGKPNVDIAFEVVRVVNSQEQPVAALSPQNYSDKNLPADFDLRVGHPLFATVSAPLASLKRGSYRLKILVNDRVGGRTATADTDFTVAATAMSLLRDAPPLGPPFRRESILSADTLPVILAALRPPAPSPALQRAFELAAATRFVELMVEEPVPPSEEGVRAALRGLAQMSVGEGSSAVQFQRAQLLGAPLGITRVLSGAARAMQLRDADAISAWQEAIAAGAPRSLVAPLLLEAYLRRNDYTRAAAVVSDMKGAAAGWSRGVAAVLIATQKEDEAIALLETRLATSPNDADAQWLLLHALFAQLARNSSAPPAARERFSTLARAYVDGRGANRALADEWLQEITNNK
jgi:hypothetical protein